MAGVSKDEPSRVDASGAGPGSPRYGDMRRSWISRPLLLLRLELHHLLALLAQPVDPERDHVAGLEKFRLRLHAEPDPRRRAGDDDIARLEHEELRAVPDEVPAIEDHRLGVAALALLAVDVEPHVEALRILDLVLGDQPGAERPECLAALALDPLSGPFDLEHALGHIIGH